MAISAPLDFRDVVDIHRNGTTAIRERHIAPKLYMSLPDIFLSIVVDKFFLPYFLNDRKRHYHYKEKP